MELLDFFVDKNFDNRERLRVLMRPVSHYPAHVASSSKASLDPSDARAILQQQGLAIKKVTARPAVELYNRCKLPHPKDVRLLRLFSAAQWKASEGIEQPLVAQIYSGSLYDLKGRYESLSYVWGSEEKPKSIVILFVEPAKDSEEASMFDCNITENLWMALTDVRSLFHHRDVWTDAICINQEDNHEKNVQVAQMRDVYDGSKTTLAHLGPRFDGIDALVAFRDSHLTKHWFYARPMAPDHAEHGQYMLFQSERGIVRANQSPVFLLMVLMQRVIVFLVLRWGFEFVLPKLWARTVVTGLIAMDLTDTLPLMFFKNKFFSHRRSEVIFSLEQIVYGVGELFSRPWFHRVWIVQECVVSTHVRFMIGREQFEIGEVVSMISAVRELKSVAADVGSNSILAFSKMCLLRDSKGHATPSLSTFLSWSWSIQLGDEATNPRDRIFALIGLLSEKNPAYFINYALDAHDVFWRYARVLIQSPDGPMLLEDPRRHYGLIMPSWVPDFAGKSDHGLYGALYLYFCSKGLAIHPYQLGPTMESIEVHAIVLSNIDFVGRQYGKIPEGFPEPHKFFLDPEPSLNYSQHQQLRRLDMEPRDDIENIMKCPLIKLPRGLTTEIAAEVLMQAGIFLDQTAGSLGAPTKRELCPVEKYPDETHARGLITKTLTAARYFKLYAESFLLLMHWKISWHL